MPDDEASKIIATQAGEATPAGISLLIRVLPWIGLWGVSVAAIVILSHRNYPLDDVQTLFFPLLLFVFWRISVSAHILLPRGLLLIAICFWLIGAMHVRGYYPAEFFREGVYLGRLAGDTDGTTARALYQRYNQIAEHYGLTPMYIIHRSLGLGSQLSEWVSEHPQTDLVISGDVDWLQVFLPPTKVADARKLPGLQVQDSLAIARQSFAVPQAIGLQPIPIPGTPSEFLLVVNPPSISLPTTPTELTRHYLAWLASGVSSDAQLERLEAPEGFRSLQHSAPVEEVRREKRLFYFGNSSFVDGPWKTYAPRGLSLFYEANISLLEAVSDGPNSSALQYIEDKYAAAAGYVRERYEPELYAAIYNNAAVALLLLGSEEEQFVKAEKLLGDAGKSQFRSGKIAALAPVAQLNEQRGQSLGLLSR